MVLCADPSRATLGDFDFYPQPDLADCVAHYTACARLTNPDARVVGVSLNTSSLSSEAANALMARTEDQLGLPCVDPVRGGVAPHVERLHLPVPVHLKPSGADIYSEELARRSFADAVSRWQQHARLRW